MDVKKVIILVFVIMLIFLLVGGYYIQDIFKWIGWIKYFLVSYWGYKFQLVVQYFFDQIYFCYMVFFGWC